MNIRIRKAKETDRLFLIKNDVHIDPAELDNSISLGRVYIAQSGTETVGWLRYNLFWDNTPFVNMLYVLEPYQGQGIGKALMLKMEEDMQNEGYSMVMTSTASDEFAQHFYNKLGYKTIGGFTYKNDPYEIIMSKMIGE